MARITIEEVNEIRRASNWKVLTDEYTNLDTIMTFQCDEGHKVITTWRKARRSFDCPVCHNNEYKTVTNSDIKVKPKGVHRVLALDQSSQINGWSVYDDLELVNYGVYSCSMEKPIDRMVDISEWLTSMIYLWKPDEVGFEETNYNPKSNHNTFKLLSQVMGRLMLTAAQNECEVTTALISSWRAHWQIKGRSRADKKKSAQHRVKQEFDISVTDDEAEAICIGRYLATEYQDKGKTIIGDWSM